MAEQKAEPLIELYFGSVVISNIDNGDIISKNLLINATSHTEAVGHAYIAMLKKYPLLDHWVISCLNIEEEKILKNRNDYQKSLM